MEEYFKILRSGAAADTLRMLKETQLLRAITPELDAAGGALWEAVARLDAYRRRFSAAPDTLTNAILAGTLLVPLGLVGPTRRFSADPLDRRVDLGILPVPRRDLERLQQILALQPRLLDMSAPLRAQRGVLHRHVINDALTWLEIHADRPEVVHHWRALQEGSADGAPVVDRGRERPEAPGSPFRRRRRRRRRPHPAVPRE
jgi:tRNA nucleotidyltransferase/poly(A) polymerase